ncbi:TetR/AcrR family transcriptional regulator [Actinomycetospora chlora]|uniref:TetR/AcrR family transcriptional regulator n=1 Tax=Actinomycetospora chlora TaxID=663608 RepID=A0ABP9A119_9PSEU
MAGLRETKKAQTRQRIADAATLLFVERGFDAVSVAEVAAAAEVSKMTVFNHFPRKEDMFFDRIPEATALLVDAVRARAPGTTPLAAVRALLLELTAQRHPLSGIRDGVGPFLRTVQESPALVARLREVGGEIEDAVSAVFAEAGVVRPELLAALTVAAIRTVVLAGSRRILAGEASAAVVEDHVAALHAAFDALERAAAGPASQPRASS